jgi:hypothetical protein
VTTRVHAHADELGSRPVSLGNHKLTRKQRAELKVITGELRRAGVYRRKPKTYADCLRLNGPCGFVSCRYNLYLDVIPVAGRPSSAPIVKLNFPHLEVWEMAETCALKVAMRGATVEEPTQGVGLTLEEVGELVNLTSQRVEQLESVALAKLLAGGGLREFAPDGTEEP